VSRTLRLPAAERRQELLETALRIFAAGSYRGVTTADIARAAGVSEPVLYRHFPSKRDLYLACFDEAWRGLRESWETAIAATGDPAHWLHAMRNAALAIKDEVVLPSTLWIQALAEAGDDAAIRDHLREHMRGVHAFARDVIARAQAAGGIVAERDADAEAWVFVAGGLLLTAADRLGGLLGEDELARIGASRTRWLTGRE
jgi:AcrR family transcriptional regulator